MLLMERFADCAVNSISAGQLLIGDEKTCLIDCGMAFCADKTIAAARAFLGARPLDYIFASHTHYDHIGALPYFRREWPDVKLATTERGARTLEKETPRRVIRELSTSAAEINGIAPPEYNDDDFRADMTFIDGERITLGGLTVEIIETPGHTRDSVTFYIPELRLMILSETLGVRVKRDDIKVSYLTSCGDAIASIERCAKYPFERLSNSHTGLLDADETDSYFTLLRSEIEACRDFILSLNAQGASTDEIERRFFEKYANETLRLIQPENAFRINAKLTIDCTLREYA